MLITPCIVVYVTSPCCNFALHKTISILVCCDGVPFMQKHTLPVLQSLTGNVIIENMCLLVSQLYHGDICLLQAVLLVWSGLP